MPTERLKRLLPAVLAVYWLTLFIGTHIPKSAGLVPKVTSDKALHFGAYFGLAILLGLWWSTKEGENSRASEFPSVEPETVGSGERGTRSGTSAAESQGLRAEGQTYRGPRPPSGLPSPAPRSALRAPRSLLPTAHYLLLWGVLAAYAVLDELLQIPVGRHAEFSDWTADVVGAGLGLGSLYLIGRIVSRKQRPAYTSRGLE